MPENYRSPAKIVRRLRYLPWAMWKMRNWPSFIFHYALGLTPRRPYRFRNGAQLSIMRAIDHVPIIEVFLEEDYGAVTDGTVVLDLGANIGAFSIYATATAQGVQVFAYEPLPAFCAALRENIRLNQAEEAIRVFPCAAAASSGTRSLAPVSETRFFPALLDDGSDEESIAVECTTLAKILETNHLPQVDLLKMDCEGAEFEILYATPVATLLRIKQIRLEYHNLDSGERHVDGLKEFLIGNGFTITRLVATSESHGNLWVERRTATAPQHLST